MAMAMASRLPPAFAAALLFSSLSLLIAMSLVSASGTQSPPEAPQPQQLSHDPLQQRPDSDAPALSPAPASASSAAASPDDSSLQAQPAAARTPAAAPRRRQAAGPVPRSRAPPSPLNQSPSSATRALIEQLSESLDLTAPSAGAGEQDRAAAPEFLLELYTAVANESTGRTRQATPFEADAIHGIPETGTPRHSGPCDGTPRDPCQVSTPVIFLFLFGFCLTYSAQLHCNGSDLDWLCGRMIMTHLKDIGGSWPRGRAQPCNLE